MKFHLLHAKNLRSLVGRCPASLMRHVDDALVAVYGGAKYDTTRPMVAQKKGGGDQEVLAFLRQDDGSVAFRADLDAEIAELFGFSVAGTQLFVGFNGWVTGVPLNAVLKGAAPVDGKHLVYAHGVHATDPEGGSYRLGTYIGVTKPGLMKRYQQHLASAFSGSPYRFHEALRRAYATGGCVHQVCVAGLSKEEAYSWEEQFVAGCSLYPHGLNMIPGGNAGLAYLRSIGALTPANAHQPRERIIAEFFATRARDGRPNPLIAARWRDDEYAASIICGNPRNLSVDQVSQARELLAEGFGIDAVAAAVGARNARIIRGVASGATYGRVH